MKTSFKRLLSLVLVVLTLVGCAAPVLAAESVSCAHDNESKQTLHNTVKATCENPGYEMWYCDDCNEYYVKKGTLVEAGGHNYVETITKGATCKEEGSKCKQCSECGTVLAGSVATIEKTNHKPTDIVYPEGYSCATGTNSASCKECGAKDIVIPAGTHQWDKDELEPTCTEADERKCVVCDVTETLPAVGHDFAVKSTTAPVNCGNGSMTFACKNCDEEYTVVIKGREHTEADYGTPYNGPAKCTEAGYTGRINCKWCNEVLVEGEVVVATGHSLKDKDGLAPTCTEKGYTDYKACEKCDYITGKTEIPANGHSWGDWVYAGGTAVKPGCQKTDPDEIDKTRTCTVCSYSETIPEDLHDYSVEGGTAATCTTYGYEYMLCATCGKQTKGNEIAPLGHNLKDVKAEAATCTTSGMEAGKQCQRCDYYEGMKGIPALGHDYSKDAEKSYGPTCTEEGRNYCTRCDGYEAVAALGHSYTNTFIYQAATCAATGVEKRKCSVCETVDSTYSKDIPKNPDNHTKGEETYPTQAPTCTEAGFGTSYCKDCNAYMESVTIPALNHEEFENKVWFEDISKDLQGDQANYTHKIIVEATCTAPGKYIYKCTRHADDYKCHWIEAEIPQLENGEHKFTQLVDEAKAATCDTNAVTAKYKCEFCLETTGGVEQPNTSFHSVLNQKITNFATTKFSQNTVDSSATCTGTGSIASIKCSECTKIYTWKTNKYELVEDVKTLVIPANGHTNITIKGYAIHCPVKGCGSCGVAADKYCEGNGYKAGVQCSVCKAWDTERELINNDKNKNHLGYYLIEAVKPTCYSTGSTESWACTECAASEAPVVENLNKVAHSSIVTETDWNGADCTTDYFDYNYCSVCENAFKFGIADFERTKDDAYVTNYKKAPGHLNSFGVVIEKDMDCGDDRIENINEWLDVNAALTCSCGFVGSIDHGDNFTDARIYKPTCVDKGYTISVCTDCSLEKVTNIVPVDENAHEWKDVVIQSATFTENAVVSRECTLCLETEKNVNKDDSKLVAYDIKIQVVGETFVKSGTVKVKIILTPKAGAEALAIGGMQIYFPVSANLVCKGVVLADEDIGLANAGIDNGVAKFALTAYPGINFVVGEASEIATIEFLIKDTNEAFDNTNIANETFTIGQADLNNSYVNNKDSVKYKSVVSAESFEGKVSRLGDIDGDGEIGGTDASKVVAVLEQQISGSVDGVVVVEAGSENEILDVNKDGYLSLQDVTYLQMYMVGKMTEQELNELGLATEDKWVDSTTPTTPEE